MSRSLLVSPVERHRVAEPGRCGGADKAPPHPQCKRRSSTGYDDLPFCPDHDEAGQRMAERLRTLSGITSAIATARLTARLASRAGRTDRGPLVVIPCSGSKTTQPSPASDLYTGSLHRAARAAADAIASSNNGRVVILSALHGLIALDAIIEPYNVTIGDPEAVTHTTLADQLTVIAPRSVIALTPNRYTALLAGAAHLACVPLATPLAGCRGIGEQRARLVALRDGRTTVPGYRPAVTPSVAV